MSMSDQIGAVVIGRNEGARLIRCLQSLQGVGRVIYVDSGSTDGSQEAARAAGAEVVTLETDTPFTAARARNAGLAAVTGDGAAPEMIQFIDGDCELRDGWLETAWAFLQENPGVAVVCGRRRERHPEASLYNAMIDREWDTPIGQTRACGGDALMRTRALTEVGGYDPTLIAGEEPELCVRLRAQGWQIWRLDAEMTWHDAAIFRFGQWWTRARRAGFAYAQGAALHGAPPERHNVAQHRRALLWGAVLPAGALAGALITPFALLLLLAWPAQMLRLRLRGMAATQAVFTVLGKLPEALGSFAFHRRRLLGGRQALIEYK